MSTKGKRPLRSMTPSEKVHAINRIHEGESKASVARDINVPESTLRGWCKNEEKLRFMARQMEGSKLCDPFTDKMDATTMNRISAGVGVPPPEKRPRLQSSGLPLSFPNKLKFDELTSFKRNPDLNALEFGSNKVLNDLNNGFNNLNSDYNNFNFTTKSKLYGADISRPADPSINAISPLSSLNHLSGLTSLAQSPLAISFNELTANLSLLAQLNPGFAAMSGLGIPANSIGSPTSATNKTKVSHLMQNGHREAKSLNGNEPQPSLTVKNWAKQKAPSTSTTTTDNNNSGNYTKSDGKVSVKPTKSLLNPVSMAQNGNLPPLSSVSEDPLLYWLKSQQALMNLNNMYPPAGNSPMRSSSPQPQSQSQSQSQSQLQSQCQAQAQAQAQATVNMLASTPPIIPNPLTPSSTPSGSLDDKNAAWYNWCKALGASLTTTLSPATAIPPNTMPLGPLSTNSNENMNGPPKNGYDNILYTHLTKASSSSPSIRSSASSIENVNNNNETVGSTVDLTGRPEDLSTKLKISNANRSPLPTPEQSPESSHLHSETLYPKYEYNDEDNSDTYHCDGVPESKAAMNDLLLALKHCDNKPDKRPKVEDKEDNLITIKTECNTDFDQNDEVNGCNTESSRISDDNNNSDKTAAHDDYNFTKDALKSRVMAKDERNEEGHGNDDVPSGRLERVHGNGTEMTCIVEGIKNGEKFLRWLEDHGKHFVTANQLMQFKGLLESLRNATTTAPAPSTGLGELTPSKTIANGDHLTETIELEDSSEEGTHCKMRARRRK